MAGRVATTSVIAPMPRRHGSDPVFRDCFAPVSFCSHHGRDGRYGLSTAGAANGTWARGRFIRRASTLWAGTEVVLGASRSLAPLGPARHVVWSSPMGLFVVVTVAASLSLLAVVSVVAAVHRRNLAEIGLPGSGLDIVSVLPLVHGLSGPGRTYRPNAPVRTSAFRASPLALMM